MIMLTVIAYILMIPIIVFGCIFDEMTSPNKHKKHTKKRHHY